MQDDLPDWELDLTAPMYDETGNIPSNECESPASDYWDDGLVWDTTANRYVFRTETPDPMPGWTDQDIDAYLAMYGTAYDETDDWEPNPNIVANPCNCEHPEHFPDMDQYDPNQHGYLQAPHDGRRALYVGEICNSCANGHYRQFLYKEDKG